MADTQVVSEAAFKSRMRDLNAIPDGFRANGGFQQTKWKANGVEVGRFSRDSQGDIYELIGIATTVVDCEIEVRSDSSVQLRLHAPTGFIDLVFVDQKQLRGFVAGQHLESFDEYAAYWPK